MTDNLPRRIILAITGASGAILGIRALEMLKQLGVETHLIISRAGNLTITRETQLQVKDVQGMANAHYDPRDITAPIASGSFITTGMLVLPCSIKTLSAIANSYANTLIARAADVCLKEGRPCLLAVRETPFHAGHIHLMRLATQAGAVICPPIPSFYNQPQSMDDLINNMVGRLILRLGIENPYYTAWGAINSE